MHYSDRVARTLNENNRGIKQEFMIFIEMFFAET